MLPRVARSLSEYSFTKSSKALICSLVSSSLRTLERLIHDLSVLRDGGYTFEVVRHQSQSSAVVGHFLDGADTLSNRDYSDSSEFAVFLSAFTLNAELQGAEVSTRVVRENNGLGVRTTLCFSDNSVVIFHLLALNVFGSTGDFATLEYQNRGNLQDSLLVEVGSRIGYSNVS